VNFRRGYEHRRINLTFLYGHPGDKTCAMRGGGSAGRRNLREQRVKDGETRPGRTKYPYDSRIPGSGSGDALIVPGNDGVTEPTVPGEFKSGGASRQEL
jgi:hypothetical protein